MHFELTCTAFGAVPSVGLFRWFTISGRMMIGSLLKSVKDNKNCFIFVSPDLLPEALPFGDLTLAIEDDAPTVSLSKNAFWKRMCENPTHSFNFPEGMLVLGGVSALLSYRPKAIVDGVDKSLWALLQGDAKNLSFTHGNEDCEENPEVGTVPDSGTPSLNLHAHPASEGSHNL
ncbi:hypothetical protein Hanom_Chr04g00382901 [Helianthus anomalus]